LPIIIEILKIMCAIKKAGFCKLSSTSIHAMHDIPLFQRALPSMQFAVRWRV
jgi:hypothetical protein